MVRHFLPTSRKPAENGTASQLKVRALVVGISWNEENFLFKSNGGNNGSFKLVSKTLEKTLRVFGKCLVGAKQRCLLI
jgi:hypothetical protein